MDDDLVDRLYKSLHNDGFDVRRDCHDIDYAESISAFMDDLSDGRCVIVVMSNKYAQSPFCMRELLHIKQKHPRDFTDRILPFVLPDGSKIFDAVKRLEFVSFWEKRVKTLQSAIVKANHNQGARTALELRLAKAFVLYVDELLSMIADKNALNPTRLEKNDFQTLKRAVMRRIGGLPVVVPASGSRTKLSDKTVKGARPAIPAPPLADQPKRKARSKKPSLPRDLFEGESGAAILQLLSKAIGLTAPSEKELMRTLASLEPVALAKAVVDAAKKATGRAQHDRLWRVFCVVLPCVLPLRRVRPARANGAGAAREIVEIRGATLQYLEAVKAALENRPANYVWDPEGPVRGSGHVPLPGLGVGIDAARRGAARAVIDFYDARFAQFDELLVRDIERSAAPGTPGIDLLPQDLRARRLRVAALASWDAERRGAAKIGKRYVVVRSEEGPRESATKLASALRTHHYPIDVVYMEIDPDCIGIESVLEMCLRELITLTKPKGGA